MAPVSETIGIIGGSGMLGSAISTALLESGSIEQSKFWFSNRSGKAPGLEGYADIHVTKDNQELVDNCDVIILCVPPAQFSETGINASGKLVVSAMAGVTTDQIKSQTGFGRVVRAMSSPAASLALAYSPWVASAEVTPADRIL